MSNLHTYLHPRVKGIYTPYLHPRVKGMQNLHLPPLLRCIPQFAQICIIFVLSKFEANLFFRPVYAASETRYYVIISMRPSMFMIMFFFWLFFFACVFFFFFLEKNHVKCHPPL